MPDVVVAVLEALELVYHGVESIYGRLTGTDEEDAEGEAGGEDDESDHDG